MRRAGKGGPETGEPEQGERRILRCSSFSFYAASATLFMVGLAEPLHTLVSAIFNLQHFGNICRMSY